MNAWHIRTIGSTDIRLHPVVPVYLLYAYAAGYFPFTLIALISIALHEGGHAIAAVFCGQPPSSIEITPIGAVLHLEDLSRLPARKRILTAIAGPAVTLMLCFLSVQAAQWRLISFDLPRLCFLCNLAILLMNLLPFLPLDGGRILHTVLDCLVSRTAATKCMKVLSHAGGVLLILINIFISLRHGGWNLSLAFSGCCIIYSASTFTLTQTMEELRWLMDRKIRMEQHHVTKASFYIALQHIPLRLLIKSLPTRKSAFFCCMEAGTQHIKGVLHEREIIQRYLDKPSMTLGEAIGSTNNSCDSFKYSTK